MNTSQEQVAALQQAVEELQAALEEERQGRQAFVSLVTHELRVPMTSIKGYTDLLLKGIMGPVNEAQTGFLNIIRSNVERMSAMVADLSDINKIEGGRLSLTPAPVAVAGVVEEALSVVEAAAGAKRLSIERHIPGDLPDVRTDRSRFIQVLRSVLTNAMQYTPGEGQITLDAYISDDGEAICVAVADTGIGIPADEQDRIFEMFFRASDEQTRATPGNGLSLHLAKRLLALQGGHIGFESEQGRGSTFTLTLPAASAQDAS